MARYQVKDSYLDVMILADNTATIPLQNPLAGGGPLAIGAMFTIVDNLGVAGTTNIAPVGPIAGGTTGTAISANYGSASFTWVGNTYVQK